MKKHLIPDPSALPGLPYRLLTESWWLEEDHHADSRPQARSTRHDGSEELRLQDREVQGCN